jgi:hypothetical protein
MINKLSLFILMIAFLACEQKQSSTEADYIKNLEEKNRALERELQSEKNKPPVVIQSTPTSAVPIQGNNKRYNEPAKDFFTVGSTEDEVINVMGDPTNIIDFGTAGMKEFSYGLSTISFKDGKVNGYNNFGNNLKVKLRKRTSSDN